MMTVNVEQMIKRLEQVGGYIHPSVDKLSDGSELTHFGMTLRDYFAGQALAGLCANSGGPFQANGLTGWGIVNCKEPDIALQAYELADAMLQARSKSYD